jgi:hypothetical protein
MVENYRAMLIGEQNVPANDRDESDSDDTAA